MKFTWFYLFLFVSLSCSPKKQSQAPGPLPIGQEVPFAEPSIEWNENRKLKWIDFQSSSIPPQSDVAAVTSCGFGYRTNLVLPFSKPTFIVSNIFYPRQSWVKKSEQFRAELLEHEQLHFDISEVYTRRLRKEFKQAKLNYFNMKKESDRIFKKIFEDYSQRQALYENETAFSMNAKAQTEWQLRIKDELHELNAYAN